MENTPRNFFSKPNRTLEIILFIILLHAILPAIFIIIYLNLGQRDAAKKTFESNLSQITQFAAYSFEKELLKTRSILQVISKLPEVQTRNQEKCEIFVRSLLQVETNQIYTRIGAADKEGNVYCNTVPLTHSVNVANTDYFQQVKKTERFVFGGYSISKTSGNEQIITAYPIFNNKGEFDGIIGAAIDVTWLGMIAERVKLPSGYTITLLDKNGVVIARHPHVESLIGSDSKQKELGKKIFSSPQKEGIVNTVGLDNIKRLYAFTTTEDALGVLYITIGAPVSESEKFANQNSVRDILILLGVILSAVIICSFDLHYVLFKWKK